MTGPKRPTPHCGVYCRIDYKGRDVHYHGNAKRKRFRKGRHPFPHDDGRVFDDNTWHGARRAYWRDRLRGGIY